MLQVRAGFHNLYSLSRDCVHDDWYVASLVHSQMHDATAEVRVVMLFVVRLDLTMKLIRISYYVG